MVDDFKQCAALVRGADRDRYLASLFAPSTARDALFALYAFNVEISRVRALAREPMPGEIRLQWWHEVLGGQRAGEAAANPIAAALLTTVANHNLPVEKLTGVVEARRFDVYNDVMTSFAELKSYASQTSAMIFELAAHILTGQSTPVIANLASEAGEAETFADILALLPQHAARRQLFIPLETLRHYGVEAEDVFAGRTTRELRAALAEFRLRARLNLEQVGSTGPELPRNAQPAFLSLAPLGQWLLDMERPSYDPFQPPKMALWRRQWRIWRAAKSFSRIGA
jgi:15-cis-phytoene synthase